MLLYTELEAKKKKSMFSDLFSLKNKILPKSTYIQAKYE